MSHPTEKTEKMPIEGHCDPRFAAVREVFADCLARNREVGAAIAFTLDGERVVDLWGGHRDAARTRPWTRDTLVNTYSTTKGMTAICANQLIEQGRLELDAPVARYWPEFAQAGKDEIPVRWLLTHQAGLPALREPLPEAALYDWATMTKALAAESPWWPPGTKHGYHPVTFGFLVGELVRRVSGLSLGRYLREHVTGPLDADFFIGLSPEQEARAGEIIGGLVPGRSASSEASSEKSPPKAGAAKPRLKGPLADFVRDMADPSTMVGAAFNNPRQPRGAVNGHAWRAAEIPAANGHGTARALARIYGALARGGEQGGVRLLEPETIRRARTEQVSGPDFTLGGMPMRYGLGFTLRSDLMPLSPNEEAFGHPGAGGSIGMADPQARVGFGFVMNKMAMGLVGGATGFAAIRAFYEAL